MNAPLSVIHIFWRPFYYHIIHNWCVTYCYGLRAVLPPAQRMSIQT